jgi:hypothetical protein
MSFFMPEQPAILQDGVCEFANRVANYQATDFLYWLTAQRDSSK